MIWESIELGQLSKKIDYGLTASALRGKIGYKFLRITDIKNDHVDWESVPFCDCDKKNLSKYRLATGDIVFARTGNAGKSYLIKECPPDSLFASYLIRVRPQKKELDPSFLSYYFKTPQYWSAISKSSNGTTLPGVNSTSLKKLKIPLPPLDIQKKIATVLDKADQLRQKRKKAIEKLDQLIQSVFFDMFGDPVLNPKGWEISTLGESCYFIKDGPHVSPEYVEKGIPFVSVNNIIQGEWNFKNVRYISKEDHQKFKQRCNPEKGDILYTKGGTTGYAKYIDIDIEFSNWVHIALLKFHKNLLDGRFLESMLNSQYCYIQSQRYTRGIANRDLVLGQIKKIKILFPHIDLQKKFAHKINHIRKIIDKNKAGTINLDNLFNSLLQQAFKGELKFNDKAFKGLEKEIIN